MHVFSSAYNEYTVIPKEYTGWITGVDCISMSESYLEFVSLMRIIITCSESI